MHFSWKEGSPSKAICIGHIAGDYTNSRKSRRLIILRLDKCAVDLYTGAVDSIIYLLKRMKKLYCIMIIPFVDAFSMKIACDDCGLHLLRSSVIWKTRSWRFRWWKNRWIQTHRRLLRLHSNFSNIRVCILYWVVKGCRSVDQSLW